jgi:hypothetical protein
MPFKSQLKKKIDYKLVALILRFYPNAFSLVNLSLNLESTLYDVAHDKIASTILQNINFPKEIELCDRVMIILVPFHNTISGGIYSFFSIASHMKKMKRMHGWEVLVMTYPNLSELTYYRNRFISSEIDIFRFSQILRLKNAKELFIFIPELFSGTFLSDMDDMQRNFLKSKQSVYINIMNQNIKLMPKPHLLISLKSTFKKVGQSIAHHSYFNQKIFMRYKMNCHFLPAYTDLSSYKSTSIQKKDKLIIYSPDKSKYKSKIIAALKFNFPDFKFIEIFDMKFDQFMEYSTKCMFSITFGEGFDGYLAQPMQQGSVAFAVYNEEFFPSKIYLKLYNIFESEDAMLKELPVRMKKMLSNKKLYKSTNSKFVCLHKGLYSANEYKEQLNKLSKLDYDLVYSKN